MEPLHITRDDARVTALAGLIDYAGLFPPTSLGMDEAVAEYRAARQSPHSWLVERFICPASRLEELAGALVPTLRDGEAPWRTVAIGDASDEDWLGSVAEDVTRIRVFDEEMRGGAAVEVVEKRVVVGPRLGEEVAEAARLFGRMAFFEVPWSTAELAEAIGAVATGREDSGRALGAKIRCGGATADAFPPPGVVAAFLVACRDHALPVKATAGLHHPYRNVDPATGFTHHGFLNVLVAAALAAEGADTELLTEVIADPHPESFRFDRSGVWWREHRLGAAALAGTRTGLFVAYGSCSIDEPVEDLTALGVLPVTR